MYEHQEYLFTLGVIPPIMLWHYLYHRRKVKGARQMNGSLFTKSQQFQINAPRLNVHFLVILLALALLIVALADPYTTRKNQVTAIAKKKQIVFALDVSTSMLARDVIPNRLLKAQSFIVNVLSNLHHHEEVAVVIFAGRADTYVPLTTDYRFVKKEVSAISVNQATKPGTSIIDALKISSLILNNDSETIRSICILSDGETPEQNIDIVAAKLHKSGINLFALGIGTSGGSKIIETNDRGIEKVKLAKDGRPVITRLHDENLKKVIGNKPGNYDTLEDTQQEADKFTIAMDNLKANVQALVFTPQKWFQWFLLGALLLLIIEILIS